MNNIYANHSLLFQKAIDAFAQLPGVGYKTAQRLALHLLSQEKEYTHNLTQILDEFVENIYHCCYCHNISDQEVCPICNDPKREPHILCVVENIRDVLAIEQTGHYRGRYHVLGGVISPLQGIGADQLYIRDLPERILQEDIKEVVLALGPTNEGDTTNFYIYQYLTTYAPEILITTIARGVAIGDSLEYTDPNTLGKSIENRVRLETIIRD